MPDIDPEDKLDYNVAFIDDEDVDDVIEDLEGDNVRNIKLVE